MKNKFERMAKTAAWAAADVLESKWAIVICPDPDGNIVSAFHTDPRNSEFVNALLNRLWEGCEKYENPTIGEVDA